MMREKMSKRITVYLPESVYEVLEDRAAQENRSISNLSAFLLEVSVRDRLDRGDWKPRSDKP